MIQQVARLTSDCILQIEDLYCRIQNRTVLDNLSLSMPAGSFCCLLGESGCGKSTLLRSIAGLQSVQRGSIIVDERLMVQNGESLIATENRKIGMVFQDYALFPHLTVRDNLLFGIPKCDQFEQQATVNRLLNLVRLPDCGKRYPHELSGGQQQRIALARSLAQNPSFMLLDEPFSNIDEQQRLQIMKEVKNILKQQYVSALLVTHDVTEALMIADYIGIILDGKIVQWGTPYEIYHHPTDEQTAMFCGNGQWIPAIIGTLEKQQWLVTPLGVIPLTDKIRQRYQELIQSTLTGQSIKLLIREDNLRLSITQENNNPFHPFNPNEFNDMPTVLRYEIINVEFAGSMTFYTIKPIFSERYANHPMNHCSLRIFERSYHKFSLGDMITATLQLEEPILVAK